MDVNTMLPNGEIIFGYHKETYEGLVHPSKIDWRRVSRNKLTGIYLTNNRHEYEFRGFYNKNDYVIIGVCLRIHEEMPEYDRWESSCREYIEEMQNAH